MNQKMEFGITIRGFKKHFINTGWLGLDQLLRLLSGLLIGLWVARYLGPENFGSLNFILAYLSIFGAISRLGLDEIIVRELVNENSSIEDILSTAFKIRIIGSILIIILIYLSFNWFSIDEIIQRLIIITAFSLMFQSIDVLDLLYQSKINVKTTVKLRIIQLICSGVLKIFLIINSASLKYFVFMILVDSILIFSLYFIPLSKNTLIKKFFFGRLNLKLSVSLLKDSWPLILSSLVIAIYMRIDQVMIKSILNSIDLGIYSAAVRISEIFYFVPIIISTSLFPSFVNLKRSNPNLYKKRILQFYTLMSWIAISFAILTTLFGGFAVNILFGDTYTDASNILKIHIWSAVFVFIGVAFNKILMAENLAKIALKRTALGAVTNVILNYFLIPKYGIQGAAYSTLIAQFIANMGYDLFEPKIRVHLGYKLSGIFLPLKSLK